MVLNHQGLMKTPQLIKDNFDLGLSNTQLQSELERIEGYEKLYYEQKKLAKDRQILLTEDDIIKAKYLRRIKTLSFYATLLQKIMSNNNLIYPKLILED